MSVSDVERFTEGDCHFLARALHLKTGWPIMAFCCACHNGRHPDLHAFVLMPDGRALDVEGPCSVAAFKKRWDADKIAEFTWTALRKEFRSPLYGSYTYARAKVVADRLVKEWAT